MLQTTNEYKGRVREALLEARKNFDGSDKQYAQSFGINNSVYSRIKKGESGFEDLLQQATWINVGMRLDVANDSRKWVTVATEVLQDMERSMVFCQDYAKSFMLVDDAGIGKTYVGKYMTRKLKNCFYVDGSQAKSKIDFIRLLARTIGVDDSGKVKELKAQIKYVLKVLPKPLLIIDEAGDLDDKSFLEIKEIWNATEGRCGWFMMGAEGLETKVQRNINNKKPGFTEIFSRFGDRYNHIVPLEKQSKESFYRKLITEVVSANMEDKGKVKDIVRRCMVNDSGKISGLRRAESLIMLMGG